MDENISEVVEVHGDIQLIIDYKDGKKEEINFSNALLNNGKSALASCLANRIGDSFNFYINRMIFGDGGTIDGVPKFVTASRSGLFGATRVNKPVIAVIDPNVTYKVVFTSVIGFNEGNGYNLNEMGLQMNNGEIYSMATFSGVNKTSTMQLTWNWALSFL